MRVPSITELDRDPLELIETGDWVRGVDADDAGASSIPTASAARRGLKPPSLSLPQAPIM